LKEKANQKDSDHYYYKVFGLTIKSELELPELISISKFDKTDIEIQRGHIAGPPIKVDNPIEGKSSILYNSKHFYLDMGDIAKVSLTHEENTVITTDLYQEENANTMLAWIYGSVLTAALQLNNRFALHASAVAVDGALCLFCGRSGIGKSTLAAQLNLRGYPIFSDDKCVLIWDKENQQYLAEPSLQIIRLWEDATDKLGEQDFFTNPTPVVNKLNKYQYIVNDDKVIKEPTPISKIHVIANLEEGGVLGMKEITGVRKIKILQTQTHRRNYVKGLGKTKVYWEFMDHLVKKVPVYLIMRPENTPISEFVDFVQKQID